MDAEKDVESNTVVIALVDLGKRSAILADLDKRGLRAVAFGER